MTEPNRHCGPEPGTTVIYVIAAPEPQSI